MKISFTLPNAEQFLTVEEQAQVKRLAKLLTVAAVVQIVLPKVTAKMKPKRK